MNYRERLAEPDREATSLSSEKCTCLICKDQTNLPKHSLYDRYCILRSYGLPVTAINENLELCEPKRS